MARKKKAGTIEPVVETEEVIEPVVETEEVVPASATKRIYKVGAVGIRFNGVLYKPNRTILLSADEAEQLKNFIQPII